MHIPLIKALCSTVSHYHREKGRSPSNIELAAALGVCIRTIQRYKKILEKIGALIVTPDRVRLGRGYIQGICHLRVVWSVVNGLIYGVGQRVRALRAKVQRWRSGGAHRHDSLSDQNPSPVYIAKKKEKSAIEIQKRQQPKREQSIWDRTNEKFDALRLQPAPS